MRRSIAISALVIAALSAPARAQTPAATAGTNTITVVLPSLQNFYGDLKVPFELAEDTKGYDTLIDTLEVFVVGLERDKPLGVRVMSSANGMAMTMSLPVKGKAGTAKTDPQFQKFLENLWDLDLKTVPPPTPPLVRQVPTNIRTKIPGMKLQPSERFMFNGFDGYMRREPDIVHVGKELADIRSFTGGVPFAFPEGVDLGVLINGKTQSTDDRKNAFQKVRKELLGAAKKKDEEAQSAFELRDGALRQVVAELERFYAESSEIQFLWTLDNKDRKGALDISLAALPGTELEKSVALVKSEASPYAQVSAQDAAIALTAKLPLDSLRKTHAAELATLVRNHVTHLIDSDSKKDAAQKTSDKDALAILFDAMDDVAAQSDLTGCLRAWGTGNGRFDTLGVLKVADPAKFLAILQKVQGAGGPNTVELNVDKVADIDLHRIIGKSVQSNLPEIISTDGSIYIGLGAGELWYASGDTVLPRLKKAIEESRGPAGNAVAPLSVSVRLRPLTDFVDSYRKRNPLPEKPKAAPAAKPAVQAKGEKKPALPRAQRDTTKSPMEQISTLMGDIDLQKIAAKALTGTDDVIAFSLSEDTGKAKVSVSLDTGLLRFVGTAMSKFVKDNLSDE